MEAFAGYQEAFAEITRRARERFERRQWELAVADASERLDLYSAVIGRTEAGIRAMLAGRLTDRVTWTGMKAVYSGLIAGREDLELAETFFNSVTRRVFATMGVDPDIEFVDSDFEPPPAAPVAGLLRTYGGRAGGTEVVAAILRDCGWEAPLEAPGRDAALAAGRLAERLARDGASGPVDRAEVLGAPFFRRKGAYLVGRAFSGTRSIPFALALLNGERGITVDAVLTEEDDISILFSFTRSHFHVDLGPPQQLVRHLKSLLPRKPLAEIYIALGHHKHGKTEIYRDLLRHMRDTDERFGLAPGTPGMVMIVFTMPGHDVVIKIIRDRFPAIKPMTAEAIRENYRLVYRHDRAGRLVEAQEFEHLEFERGRFDPALLAEFGRDADHTVAAAGGELVVHHAYIERRVIPLDLYLREAGPDAAAAAVTDFGQAIKDLAGNGIFPGELLPKNFGVTRHGRVVCYDYDELSLLTNFSFRSLPVADDDQDDLAEEAWFGVGPRDVFPEEISRFLGLSPALREVLGRTHGDLYDVNFWQETQARVRNREIIDFFPYHPARRLLGA